MILRLFTLLVFSALCFPVISQIAPAGSPCGTEGRSPWLKKYQSGKISPITKSLETQYVPMQVTILGRDAGGGYADPLTVIRAFQVLNQDFATIGVQFYLADTVAFLNSNRYYDHDLEAGFDLMQNFSRADVINVFIVGNPAGFCGYYVGGSFDAVALGLKCINAGDHTWSHELGHFFGLPHTFLGWESVGDIKEVLAENQPAPDKLFYQGDSILVERVDGSNCLEAADGFCDTEPDYLPQRWTCNAAGVYGDTLRDPDSTAFLVPGRNIMSYSDDRCVEEFSQEQITAMTTNLGGRLSLADPATPAFTAALGEDQRLLSPENGARLDFSDTVKLRWNAVANADMYIVQVNNSTNLNGSVYTSYLVSDTALVIRGDILQARTTYYWRVRPVNRYDVSGSFSEVFSFRNGITTATIDQQFSASITLSPNPIASGKELRIEGELTEGKNLTFRLMDAIGRQIGRATSFPLLGTTFRHYLPTDGLTPGLYFLSINLDGRRATKRIVITH